MSTSAMDQEREDRGRTRRWMAFMIRDIPPQAEIHEVKQAIAHAYHATILENERWRRRNTDDKEEGCSMPSIDIVLKEDSRCTGRLQSRGSMLVPLWGQAFKVHVEAHPIQVPFNPEWNQKHIVQFQKIKILEDLDYKVQRGKLGNLRMTPWQDPILELQHKQRLAKLRTNCDIREILFGFDHFRTQTKKVPGINRPIVHRFFVEWARKFESGDIRAYLEFVDALQCLQIVIGPESKLSRQFIKVRYESIKEIQFKDSSIMFNLWNAPILEEGPMEYDEGRPRSRLSCLDEQHRRVISMFSTKFRVTFYGEDILKAFRAMVEVVGLTVSPAHRDLDTDDGLAVIAQKTNKKNQRTPTNCLNELSDTNLHRLTRTWLSKIPFPVAFQLAALLQNGLVNPIEMEELCPSIENLVRNSPRLPDDVGQMLFQFSQLIPSWTLADRLGRTLQSRFIEFEEGFWTRGSNLTSTVRAGRFWSYRATVTPTTLKLSGPFQEQSNGIIRQYGYATENFLRVNFTDEERLQMRWDRDVQSDLFVKERIGTFLKSVQTIAGREFHFLGYSNSGLREHSVWFVTPFKDRNNKLVTAEGIRSRIANFSLGSGISLQPPAPDNIPQQGFSGDPVTIARIKEKEKKLRTQPAKLGARLAQAFTTTEPSIELKPNEIEIISDITVEDPASDAIATEFTDGYGYISLQLAKEIWQALNADQEHLPSPAPSCYQVRLGGAKGVVGINPLLKGRRVVLHESMVKFIGTDCGLHIANKFDHPLALYLNRPLIAILEHQGVPIDWFCRLQTDAVSKTNDTLLSISDDAADFLIARHLGRPYGFPQIMRGLKRYGISRAVLEDAPHPILDFFLRSLSVATVHVDRELKYRARIPVPLGLSLVGVADVHIELKEGCVYICTQKPEEGFKYFPEREGEVDPSGEELGHVYVTRSPSIHPGDVQRFMAMHPPKTSVYWQNPMVNCIVFSCQGRRPPASMLGGGDLDGDLFQIIPEKDDFKPDVDKEPADYPPVLPRDLGRTVTVGDIADFVVDYINSDRMGLVSIQHLIISDQSRHGLHDQKCLHLAELHSKAVDFAKSGVPVLYKDLPRRLHPYTPDFQHKETKLDDQTNYYESPKALGVLFRAIKVRTVEELSQGHTGSKRRVLNTSHPIYKKLVDQCEQKKVPRGLMTEVDKKEVEKAFRAYSIELRGIRGIYTMGHTPLSEEEVFIGTILESAQRRNRDDMAVRLRDVSGQLVDRVRMFLQGYRDESMTREHGLHMWLVRSMYALQYALGEVACKNNRGEVVKDWKEAQCSFGMIALRSAFDCLDVWDKRRPDPRRAKPAQSQ